MRRILYFSRVYSPHDHRFLQAMMQSGDEVWVMHLETRSQPLETRPLPQGGRRIHWIADCLPFHYLRLPSFVSGFRHALKEVQPDVVLAGPIQTAAFLVALSGFRRLVSMSWGYDLLIHARRNVWMKWITRYTLKRSAAMLGDCETIRRIAIMYGMNPHRIVTFPWGVNLQHFTPDQRQPGGGETFTFLSTRSWEPIYGVDLIARAFSEVSGRHPFVRLILLGSGSQAHLLQKIFSEAGVMERVSMPGQIGFQDLPLYYRMADVYISASHSDGTSISLLEAMACGRPVIVSDIPSNREWIVPQQQGWLFKDGDWRALAERMEYAVQNREELSGMGQSARRCVEARADWSRNFPTLRQMLG